MIIVKTAKEIEILRQGGALLARILYKVIDNVMPGVTTQELNDYAEELIRQNKAQPSFKNYQNFPAALCASVNEQVVHAIPRSDVVLRQGDIIGLDLGIWYEGRCTDMARTVPVGTVSAQAMKLLRTANKALDEGIRQVIPGHRIGDISAAIQVVSEKGGYSVVRTLFGHGVGRKVHEEPRIPNFGQPNTGPMLKPGMVIAIEPMLAIGQPQVKTASDGWSIATVDGSLTAHAEDTVAVTDDGYEILTRKQ
ncbi:type I methionyl aminopeptidase [Patescibacteria group bacterium]|nr:type I methionyl aminopeptidase [Patescibacteria group bacterium]MBU1890352.1 type I methionyl aminopeptidase [Patescibacteria group bacterium]